MFQLEKSLSRPDHDYSKFGTGNWETLREEVVRRGKDPRAEMMAWWEKNYSAERMKLVVLGKGECLLLSVLPELHLLTLSCLLDDLDTLTEWVVDLFSPVVSKDLTPVSFAPDPFGPELLGSFTYMRTVKDFLALELAWPIADQTELYHTKVRLLRSLVFCPQALTQSVCSSGSPRALSPTTSATRAPAACSAFSKRRAGSTVSALARVRQRPASRSFASTST